MRDTIIFDGAYGTYIASKNLRLEFPELANIEAPDTVLDIHRRYMAGGVDAIKTNTFAANSGLIADPGMLKSILTSGYNLAAQAVSGAGVKVFADIGPIFNENAPAEYKQIADIFIECGAVNFLFETLSEIAGLKNVMAHIKANVPGAVIVASFAVGQDGYTKSGEYYETLLGAAASYGADYTGLNCVCGPLHMRDLIMRLPAGKYNLSAMPNAGYPTLENGRTVYIDNPEYYSEILLEIYSCGVKVIGGCCGTTPEHIRMFTDKLGSGKRRSKIYPTEKKTVAKAQASNGFGGRDTVVAVEINAPAEPDAGYMLSAARRLKMSGADFITIPDSPLGKARANSFMISSMLQRAAGIRAIPHLGCRDKNQIAIKGDLIAANIEGISYVLAVTGDPAAEAFRGDAKSVFGFNSYQLISFISNLNDTIFAAAPYTICAALNTNAQNFDFELERAGNKLSRGAKCLITQPVFSRDDIRNLQKAKAALGCKILAGIMPLAGYKNALYMNNEVPGIVIPEDIVTRLKDKCAAEAKDISLGYAKVVISEISAYCDGYYIMTPLRKSGLSDELVKYIRAGGE